MKYVVVLASLLYIGCVHADELPNEIEKRSESSLDDLEKVYGTGEMISLATGYQRSLLEAPATAKIITRDAIDRLGATTLKQVLNQVPGFHITTIDNRGYREIARGLNARVLILVNGIPIQNGFIAAYQDVDDFLLEDVERIEVVKGPASALYGADAEGGVVNVITRTAGARQEMNLGVQAGEFETYGGWVRGGAEISRMQLNFYGGYRSSDMTDARVSADRQSVLDDLFGTNVSRAPGDVSAQRDVVNARVIALVDAWRFTANYAEETNFGTGSGIALALDPSGIYNQFLQSYDVAYQPEATSNWTPRGYLNYTRVSQNAQLITFFPAGAFGGAFPDGVLQSFRVHETRARGEASEIYSGLPRHTVRVGAGFVQDELTPDFDARNYTVSNGLLVNTGTFAPGAGVGDPPGVGGVRDEVYYAYGQDEWRFLPDWQLIYGARWDHYSRFGGVLNPRIGLVWAVRKDVSMKWLYGTAFTPPGLTECCSNGTFSGLGNRDLDPKRLKMGEWAIQYQGPRLEGQLSVYGYKQTDIFALVPNEQSPNGLGFDNVDKRSGFGGEIEWRIAIMPRLSAAGSYAYQELFGGDVQVGTQVGAAKHQITTEVSWKMADDFSVSVNSLTIAGRSRGLGDPRKDISDYTSLGVSLRWKNVANLADLSLSAFNALNTDIREPSPTSDLPDDLEQPGRQVVFQLQRTF